MAKKEKLKKKNVKWGWNWNEQEIQNKEQKDLNRLLTVIQSKHQYLVSTEILQTDMGIELIMLLWSETHNEGDTYNRQL